MKKGLLRYALVILLGFLPAFVFAQSIKITGTVTDTNDGLPVIGCAVVDPVNFTGTVTDSDGKYTITVKSTCKTLQFSMLGYDTQEVEIGTKTMINVELSDDAINVEEVVVVGYGTQKRETITGSISIATPEDIGKTTTSDFTGALQGQLPGLSVMQSSSQPGEESFTLRLRGVSTFNSDSQSPLILIDGIEQESMSVIDPNEIASVSILKDASATAVFGVRGANGVILITTRTGVKGEKPKFSISMETGMQQFATNLEPVTSAEYARLTNEVAANYPDATMPTYTDRQIALYEDGSSPYYPNTNWYDEIYNDFSLQTRMNANFSGATDKVRYFVNAGYTYQDSMVSVLPEEEVGYDARYKMDRLNMRSNVDIDINSWITTSLKIAAYFTSVNRPGGSSYTVFNSIKEYYTCLPTTPASIDQSFYDDGYIDTDLLRPVLVGIARDGTSVGNPVANNSYYGYATEDKSQYNTSLAFDFKLDHILKGLSAKAQISYDIYGSTTLTSSFSGSTSYSPIDAIKFSVSEVNGVDVPYFEQVLDVNKIPEYGLSRSTSYSSKMNLQGMLNYNKTVDAHDIGAMFVYQFDNKTSTGSGTDLLPYNRIGYALRVTYGFDDRYLAEFNAGYNGSEQFSEENRFGFFPAVSAGWYVSNEEFMKNQKVIDNLKIRASYGIVGNDQLGSTRFLYLDINSLSTSSYAYSDISGTDGTGNIISQELIGNSNLTWETAYKQNYGFELTMFKNWNISFDYFREYRDGILITPDVPSTLGIDSDMYPKANLGIMKNHGIEVETSYRGRITKDLSYSVRGAVNFARNERVYTGETPADDDYAYPYQSQGFSNGQQFGYLIDWNSQGGGYFTSQEEIDNCGLIYDMGDDPRPGDFVYIDANEDGYINSKDYSPIGSPSTPELDYSFTLALNYKGWDFSTMFYGIGNSHAYYTGYGIDEDDVYVYQKHHLNAWTEERYANGDVITYPALSNSSGNSTSLAKNDFYVANRKFLRLKNIELGYTVPQSVLKKIDVSNVRVYVNANNLFTWTNLPFTTVDPEQTDSRSVLPLTRIINLGLNINF